MNKILKFFLLGTIFYLITYGILTISGNLDLMPFLYGVNVAAVLAVGLLQGPRVGSAFGSSSVFGSLVSSTPYLHFSLSLLPLVLIINPLVMAIYGYLPPKRYLSNRKVKAFVGGFVGVLITDIVLTTIGYYIYIYTMWGSFGFPFFLQSKVWDYVAVVLLGGISAALSVRRIEVAKPTVPGPPRVTPPTPVTSYPPTTQTTTCPRCGSENPLGHNFCGKCGSPLKADETRIY